MTNFKKAGLETSASQSAQSAQSAQSVQSEMARLSNLDAALDATLANTLLGLLRMDGLWTGYVDAVVHL